MKRVFDIFFCLVLIFLLTMPMLIIFILIHLTSKGPAIFWSERVGKNNIIFLMPKFRSMKTDSPLLATHLMTDTSSHITSIGKFLRRSSLDELPQLFSVLKGDMSFVGPRPSLADQDDLIALRNEKNIDSLLPGISGWAQVNGRDNLSIMDKVNLDEEYLFHQSFWFDVKILWMTIFRVIMRRGVLH